MTLPSSGPMLASMINVELGRQPNVRFHLNGQEERGLAGVPSGQVMFANFYGKSRGYPTPTPDYPQPNQINQIKPYPGTPTYIRASLSFNVNGDIDIQGTPNTPFPLKWYQGGPPPPGYRVLFTLLGFTWGGDDGHVIVNHSENPNWQDMSNSPVAFSEVMCTLPPTMTNYATAIYSVNISDGSTVVAYFSIPINAEIHVVP